jgi:hypothetical protein
MTHRKIKNKIESLEQQSSDDSHTLCLLTRHGNAHDESKSVEDAGIVIDPRSDLDELLEIWDIDVSDDEDFDPWGRHPITGELIE